MNRLFEYLDFQHNSINKHRFWWVVTLLALGGIFFLARYAQPDMKALFWQLTVLYVVDSLLFFFTDRANPKMGVLTLIFLATMELVAIIFYLISLLGSAGL